MRPRDLGLAALVLLLTACSGSSSTLRDVPTKRAIAETTRGSGCPRNASVLDNDNDDDARPRAGSVPPDFRVSTVIRCAQADYGRTGDSDRETINQSSAPVTEPFLAALRLPDQEFTDSHMACAAVAEPFVRIFLTDGHGRIIRARLPRYPCGTRPDIGAAIIALSWGRATAYTVAVEGSG